MRIHSCLWLLPFVSFCIGYLCIPHFFFTPKTVTVPCVVGHSLQDALRTLSACELFPKLLTEREDITRAPGTVLEQNPLAGSPVKVHQAVHLIITKHPAPRIIPSLIGRTRTDIIDILEQQSIKAFFYEQEADLPRDTCCAQWPSAQTQSSYDQTMIIYLSSGREKPVLLPNFIGQTVSEVRAFLHQYDIQLHLIHSWPEPAPGHTCLACRVTDQRPLAGSLVNLKKGNVHVVQLAVTDQPL